MKRIEYTTKLENLDPVRKQKYKNLLTSLSEMGFCDFDRNLRTIERVGTNLNSVFEELGKPEKPDGVP